MNDHFGMMKNKEILTITELNFICRLLFPSNTQRSLILKCSDWMFDLSSQINGGPISPPGGQKKDRPVYFVR